MRRRAVRESSISTLAPRLERRLLADLGTLVSPALGVDGATIYRHALSEIGQPPPPAS